MEDVSIVFVQQYPETEYRQCGIIQRGWKAQSKVDTRYTSPMCFAELWRGYWQCVSYVFLFVLLLLFVNNVGL